MPETLVELVAKITADAAEFKAGISESNAAIGDFARNVEAKTNNINKNFKAVGIGMMAAGGAIVGALGLATKAAADEEVGIKRLSIALKNVGVNYDDVKDSLEANIKATQRKTGISDDQQRDALNELILVTGDYNKALKIMPTALDLAASKGMDLKSAAQTLGRALEGDTMALIRMFPQLKDIAAAQDSLTKAQDDTKKSRDNLTNAEEKALGIKERLLGLQRSLRDSQQGLVHAQESQSDAIEGLTEAESELSRLPQDLEKKRRDATIDLVEAQLNLSKAIGNTKSDELDLMRAREKVSNAEDRIKQIEIDGSKDLEEANDRVEAAKRRVRDASWSLISAQERLIDTEKENSSTLLNQKEAISLLATAQTELQENTYKTNDAQRALADTGDILTRVQVAVAGAAEATANPFTVLKTAMDDLSESIGKNLLPLFASFVDRVTKIIDRVGSWAEANPNLIKNLLAVGGVLIGAGGLLFAFSQISKAIIAINTALIIMHSLMGPAGWVKLAAGIAAAVGVISAFSAISNEANKIGNPSIPGFAHGGIVTQPTLAMVGESGAEAIIPLSGVGNSDKIQNNIYLDGSLIAQIVSKHFDREYRAQLT